MTKQFEPQVAMYIFANRGLGMSPGKLGAQVAHAAVLASDGSDEKLKKVWNRAGHYTKLVMLATNSEHLLTIERYLKERGFKTFLVIDEGMTEIDPHQPTALGVELVDKSLHSVSEVFSSFQLYKEKITVKFDIDLG